MTASSLIPGQRRNLGYDQAIAMCGVPPPTICIDPGDERCWPGSGQKLLDLSGNGYDFFLGDTIAVAANDPTVRGNVGRKSAQEYLELDGGDFLQYDSANETFMNDMHKATGKWSFVGWVYRPVAGTIFPIMTTASNASEIGVTLIYSSSFSALNIAVLNGTGTSYILSGPNSVADVPGWNFIGFSLSMSVPVFTYVGNQFVLRGSPGTSGAPSAAAATATLRVGAYGGASGPAPAPVGSRIGPFAIWGQDALTREQMIRIRRRSFRKGFGR